MERNPNPDPHCPYCRGTGRIELFTGSAPCECVPAVTAGPSENRVTLADLVNDPIVAEWCRRQTDRSRAHVDWLLSEITDRACKGPAGQ